MQDSQTYSPNQSTAVLLIGSPGAGKTTLALQFPKPYIFDADNNLAGPSRWLAANKKPPFKFDIGTRKSDGTEVKPFARWNHMRECLTQAAQSDEVETIILDSLTTIQEFVKDDIFRQRVDGQNMGGGRKVMITEANRDLAQLTEPEWGIYARYFTTLITTLRSIKKIIVFTAHQETRQSDTGMWQETIALQGMMRYKFSALFSDCIGLVTKVEGFGDNQKVVRMFRTMPKAESDERGLKTSFDLPPVFEDVNLLLDQLKK